MDIAQMLQIMIDRNASDLHLLVGVQPMLRLDGRLLPIENTEKLTPEQIEGLVLALMTQEQRDLLTVNKEIDFSYEYSNGDRFRLNAYHEKGSMAAALRLIPRKIENINDLRLPPICHSLAQLRQGFILVTGPTGHGKSTTIAAILESINQNRAEHIVTIEDPIEYVYEPKESIISQRELHADTHSWAVALRSVLREDPDVVLVGEMRDYETIAAALTVAETGHLVLATLHTNSAAQTVDRVIDVFPEHQQAQARMQFANTIEAIISLRLIPAVKGGRIPGAEILLATPAVRNVIREGKTHQIDNIIQTSGDVGMVSLESNLVEWIKRGVISLEAAREYALHPNTLMRLMRSAGKTDDK